MSILFDRGFVRRGFRKDLWKGDLACKRRGINLGMWARIVLHSRLILVLKRARGV